ncbi:MAG: glycerol dehydrogenase [Pseudomonadales bacterium]
MDIATAYQPHRILLDGTRRGYPPPRVFLSPQRYIQGDGVLDSTGAYLAIAGARRVGVLITRRGEQGEGQRLFASLTRGSINHVVSPFGGECSLQEIDTRAAELRGEGIDMLLAVGGGKCMDTAKGIAYRLGVPLTVIPSLASNDAPCSAVSVLYTPEGVSTGAEFYPNNPAFVIVDTGVVANAPARYLAAGIGDAMATYYEAKVCIDNPKAVTPVGTRPTLAAAAIAEVCARTLHAHGVDAMAAVTRSEVNQALENVVEANTLLSGIGFESGGLAAAHAFAQAFTAIPAAEKNHLHGEMVAIGTLGQLMLEGRPDEAERIARFFLSVQLPVHLAQISVNAADESQLDTIVAGTLDFPFIGNMPGHVDATSVRQALKTLDALGRSVVA